MNKSLTQLILALFFSLFSFCYLYCYQPDVMVVTQFLASGGQTHYVPLVGAILITLVLQLLQMFIQHYVQIHKRTMALTYLPSALLLALVTSISSDVSQQLSMKSWTWTLPLLLVVAFYIIYQAKRYQAYEPEERKQSILSQIFWINIGELMLIVLLVGLLGNSDKHFHQKAKMEHLIDKRQYAEALEVSAHMQHTDSAASMMTIYALARRQKLGDSLFCYRLVGDADVMRPSASVHSLLMPDSLLIKVTRQSANYQLCACLLNRDLKRFAHYLPMYYRTNEPMPRYYVEAWNLYHDIQQGRTPKPPYKPKTYASYYFKD